ncbi:putative transposase [Streptomonospora salina]|uniref:Putative transposase n=2 Tax=Streptomonospora salina TaxID=104205 RepID=A0A841EA16_9ACTN|nr:putative transposase [Streptomonospora salina]
MAEAFNSLFKGESIHNPLERGRGWASITDVEFAVAEYVDWYKHRRLHGELAHRAPAEIETVHQAAGYDHNADPARVGDK